VTGGQENYICVIISIPLPSYVITLPQFSHVMTYVNFETKIALKQFFKQVSLDGGSENLSACTCWRQQNTEADICPTETRIRPCQCFGVVTVDLVGVRTQLHHHSVSGRSRSFQSSKFGDSTRMF
jgi:hypothetical protein